ncbi:hypothetical protein KCU99_g332, partial [Aureobasidium melanogenum]
MQVLGAPQSLSVEDIASEPSTIAKRLSISSLFSLVLVNGNYSTVNMEATSRLTKIIAWLGSWVDGHHPLKTVQAIGSEQAPLPSTPELIVQLPSGSIYNGKAIVSFSESTSPIFWTLLG